MDELKPCPLCGSSCFALIIDGVELGSCSKEGCALWDNMISIKVWQTRPIEDRLRAEIEHLKAYCDKLAAGYPDGMLPTDIQVIKDANWTFAQQLHEAQAEIERLRAEIEQFAVVVENETGLLSDDELTPERMAEFLRCLNHQAEHASELIREKDAEINRQRVALINIVSYETLHDRFTWEDILGDMVMIARKALKGGE